MENLDDLGCRKVSKLLENDAAGMELQQLPVSTQEDYSLCRKEGLRLWDLDFDFFLIRFNVCIRDCNLSFSIVFFSLKLVLENELAKKYLQIMCSHTLLFFHSLAPNFGTFFYNFDAFSH